MPTGKHMNINFILLKTASNLKLNAGSYSEHSPLANLYLSFTNIFFYFTLLFLFYFISLFIYCYQCIHLQWTKILITPSCVDCMHN